MTAHWISEKFGRHTVVFERVIKLVGLRDGYAVVSRVRQDERGSLDFARIGDGRLRQVSRHVIAHIG